jgi:aminobenzoyl-glutamate utilization protein B
MNALGGIPATIDPMIRATAEVVAGTVLDLLRSSQTLALAREEFLRRREEAGSLPPLLPADFRAPTEFRWPEYMTTTRGREWWIPTTERDRLS